MAGSSGIILAAMVSRRNDNPLIKSYLYTLILWSVNQGLASLFVYINELAHFQNAILNALLNDADYLTLGLFLYAFVNLVRQFFYRSMSVKGKWLYTILSVIIIIPWLYPCQIWPVLQPYISLEMVKVAAFYGGLYAIAFYYRSKRKNIENNDIRKLLNRAFWLLMIFFPLMLAEGGMFYYRIYPFIISPATLFFFLINILWLSHIVRYLHLPKLKLLDSSDQLTIFSEFYNITRREREVIELILKGQSYKLIAESLYISRETVKTHINNIFRKADVKSKMELSHLIQKCEQ